MTATTENTAPEGFQHLLQPQAWLCATCPLISTFTGSVAHLQVSVPPAKSARPCLTPLSTDGWMRMSLLLTLDMFPSFLLFCAGTFD